jgi:hypothetical protein
MALLKDPKQETGEHREPTERSTWRKRYLSGGEYSANTMLGCKRAALAPGRMSSRTLGDPGPFGLLLCSREVSQMLPLRGSIKLA